MDLMRKSSETPKESVQLYWESHPCDWEAQTTNKAAFGHLAAYRFKTHPYIPAFADFESWRGCKVLEIGVGAGSDFCRWAASGANAVGVDLTERGVELTRANLQSRNLKAEVRQADAESLPFEDNSFDLVYSFGVLHHTPNTQKAIDEVWRVLRPGGSVRIMLYQLPSWVTLRTWLESGLPRGLSPRKSLEFYKESPGTKAYTRAEVKNMFHKFRDVRVEPVLTTYDLWDHLYRTNLLMRSVHALWPRWLIHLFGDRWGWNLLISCRKQATDKTAH